MTKVSKYLLTRFVWKKESNDSLFDKEGNIDTKSLVVSMKVCEIVLKWSTCPKFFEYSKNEYLHDWMLALIEFGNRLTKLRKDCRFEKISSLLCSILSAITDYSITNGSSAELLQTIKKSSIASLILNNILAKPETPPQLNLEALGCLANYSQYQEFLDKKELHECDVINRALVVYYAYKDYVEAPNFVSFLIAVLHHFAQSPAFHQYLIKRQFNLLPLLIQSASSEIPPDSSIIHTPVASGSASPIAAKDNIIPQPNDLCKMLDIYEHLTRTMPRNVKAKEVIDAICLIIKEGKNAGPTHVEQGLSCICNLASNKQVIEDEKSIELVLKTLREVHEKNVKAFLAYSPQILSGYLRKWDEVRIQKFFDFVIDLVKNLLSNFEKGNVGLLFRQFDKLCKPPDLLKRLTTSSDILPNLCSILVGFVKTPASAISNLPRVIEILNILQYMSLIDDSHKEIRKPVNNGESVLELCYGIYKNLAKLDGERDSQIIKLISSVIHILRNMYKKGTETTKPYAEEKLNQHIKYFDRARELLEGEESIRDEIIDVLIKILWSFSSIDKILYFLY